MNPNIQKDSLENFLSGKDVECIIDNKLYILNIKNKPNRLKFKAICQILDETCSINYIGFNDSNVGADCFVVNIRPSYNIIFKNDPGVWHLTHCIFGSTTEVFGSIDIDSLMKQYPRRPVGSVTIDTDIRLQFSLK